MPPFVKQASDVLDYLIKEGYADEESYPRRVAPPCGGEGFLAYHTLPPAMRVWWRSPAFHR